MKLTRDKRLLILSNLSHGLIVLLILLSLVFIAGTMYGLFFRTTPPENNQFDISQIGAEEQIFTGIGRIRIPTADPQSGMVVIFVSFVFNPDDRPFSEELALRVGDFRNIVREYIGSFPISELQQLSEESIKAELLRKFNAILRLGQIQILYFNDFMIIG